MERLNIRGLTGYSFLRPTVGMEVSVADAPKDSIIENEDEASVVRRRGHYTSSQRILLVGEGDFSFALSLASAFGSATNMVATSLDSAGTRIVLLRHYARPFP